MRHLHGCGGGVSGRSFENSSYRITSDRRPPLRASPLFMTAQDILKSLRADMPAPEYCYLTEVESGLNRNVRRADAIFINTYQSKGYRRMGIEVKVTLSDLKKELGSPDKAEAFADVVDEWYLAIPNTLYKLLVDAGKAATSVYHKIPEAWGIITVEERCDTPELCPKPVIQRRAKDLSSPRAMAIGFVVRLLRAQSRVDDQERQAIENAAWAKGRQSGTEFGMQQASAAMKTAENLRAKIQEIEKVIGCAAGMWSDSPISEQFKRKVALLNDKNFVEQTTREVVQLRKELQDKVVSIETYALRIRQSHPSLFLPNV